MESGKQQAREAWENIRTLLWWMAIACAVGAVCGLVGALFGKAIAGGVSLRGKYPQLIWLLPVAGVLIELYYKLLKLTPDPGTNSILLSAASGQEPSITLAPGIFGATVLTQLVGGSGGREGAALQLGGSLGGGIGKLCKLNRADQRIMILCGMAAVFSALFGTPVTAALFSLEVVCVGRMPYAALVPCLSSALVARLVSCNWLGTEPEQFAVEYPEISPLLLAQVLGLSVLCAFVAILFCNGIHLGHHLMDKIQNRYLKAAVGGAAILALTLLVGDQWYNGAGMHAVAAAVEEGSARPLAFLIKILFTAITLGAGFKGGEIVPCFFVGASFGCVAGPLLGMDPRLAAAIGLVAVFCGSVNCPIASLALGVEMFGGGGVAFFALAAVTSYLLSDRCSLYSVQTIAESKRQIGEAFLTKEESTEKIDQK